MREFSDSASTSFTMLHDEEWAPVADKLPLVITLVGLSPTRQWYLYKQIREFRKDASEDYACPNPSVPLHVSETPQQSSEEKDADGRSVAHGLRDCGDVASAVMQGKPEELARSSLHIHFLNLLSVYRSNATRRLVVVSLASNTEKTNVLWKRVWKRCVH